MDAIDTNPQTPAGSSSGDAASDAGAVTATRCDGRRRPPKVYRISELADYLGASRQTIHNYTAMGLLQECGWTRGGHRLYDESAFERLDSIEKLKAQGMKLGQIRQRLSTSPAT
ncbi:MAG: MerR family transcriptional regulator [Planctomycetaceae bacterium]|nr:MerR family transcriptional regulator [Planctomycetaceae bacterium]